MLRRLRDQRREKVRTQPFPPQWTSLLEAIPIYRRLADGDRKELRGHIQIFLSEKRFEGCGGLEINDHIRVIIAAHAVILLLHRRTDYYPQLESILVYPQAYEAPSERHIGDYLVEEGTEVREGESWYRGSMVLSWEDVQRGAAALGNGENVVFHEFAHQLDDESGAADGTPVLENHGQWRRWVNVFQDEYEALQAARGRRTLLDPYGAESPSEFFATATECFFERPRELKKQHAKLYEQLRGYYMQDPASW